MTNVVDTTQLKDTDTVRVRNLTNSPVVVTTPMTRKRFELAPHGQRAMTVADIRECSYDKGCADIFCNYVQICNAQLAQEFGVTSDIIEYHWGEKEILDCLNATGTEVLEDALDFAPDGIKEAIVDKAVEIELPDMRKRQIIDDALGINITHKIDNARIAKESTTVTKTAPKRRRAAGSASTTTTKKRRAATAE